MSTFDSKYLFYLMLYYLTYQNTWAEMQDINKQETYSVETTATKRENGKYVHVARRNHLLGRKFNSNINPKTSCT